MVGTSEDTKEVRGRGKRLTEELELKKIDGRKKTRAI